ncbi:restriction endonuclease subunit S [Nocardia sp. NPDC056952]|uniref:restriction endonuclease subunit S n=1 Tax=Nocardia sp. NPDC056952 TaxID=3345979 RepID=UPI0036309A43
MTWRTTSLRGAAEVALGRQRSPENADGPDMVRYLRAANVKDGVLDLGDVQSMNFTPSEQETFALRPGDVLITEGSGSLRAVGASAVWNGEIAGTVCFQNTLLRLRPRVGVDGRFLGWWSRAAFASGLFASIATGASIYHLSADRIRSCEFSIPPLEEQRRIADFLDVETSRVDVQMAALQRFDTLVVERERAVLAKELNPGDGVVNGELPNGWRWAPLAYLTDQLRQIMYGIVLPGPNVDVGVPIVKGGDVASSRLNVEQLSKTTFEIEAGYVRSRLRGGDLVIAIRGSVGEVRRVPDELNGANLTQDAARISVGSDTDSLWLEHVLQSPLVVKQMRERTTGATIRGLNIWDLKRLLIPTPSSVLQARLGKGIQRSVDSHEQIRSRISRHRTLLFERRQSLITAAVTGQFDVTTASGRNLTQGVGDAG